MVVVVVPIMAIGGWNRAGHVFRGRDITTPDVDLRISSAGYDITPLTLSSVHKWHAHGRSSDSLHTRHWHNARLRLHLSSISPSAKTAPHPSSSHLTPHSVYFNPRSSSRSTQTRSRVEHIPSGGAKFPPGFLFGWLAYGLPHSLPQGPLWSVGLAWRLAPVLMVQLSSVLAAAG